MDSITVHLAPGIRSLVSLGFSDAAAVFAAPRAVRGAREGHVDRADFARVARVAHPAGGHVLVRCFREASFAQARRARFTSPRSLSLAEREWNLFCHLRAHGVSAPEPLAVGRGRGAFFARESFVVLRELDHLRPVAEWARDRELTDVARGRLACAIGETLARIFRCGVDVPHLDGDALLASAPRESIDGTDACALHQIAERQGLVPRAPFGEHLAWSELPEVALVDVRDARIVRELGARERTRTLTALERSLTNVDAGFIDAVASRALADEKS